MGWVPRGGGGGRERDRLRKRKGTLDFVESLKWGVLHWVIWCLQHTGHCIEKKILFFFDFHPPSTHSPIQPLTHLPTLLSTIHPLTHPPAHPSTIHPLSHPPSTHLPIHHPPTHSSPANDVGQACYGMMKVREEMNKAFQLLCDAMLPQFSSLQPPFSSILGRILTISPEIFVYRNYIHHLYGAFVQPAPSSFFIPPFNFAPSINGYVFLKVYSLFCFYKQFFLFCFLCLICLFYFQF